MTQFHPFLGLPTEILQYIAFLLPNDRDLASLAASSASLARKILPSNSSVWVNRFRDRYDIVTGHSSEELKLEYKIRSIVLSQKLTFRDGEKREQTLWLQVLQSLMLEAFASDDGKASKNLIQIREVLRDSDFLNRPVSGYGEPTSCPPSELFCGVQLCVTDLALDLSLSHRCLRTDYNISRVYSYENNTEAPFISIEKPNLDEILHIRNFWQRHLTNPDEATFYNSFAKLHCCHRPNTWRSRFNREVELSTTWLGYYSCIHPYPNTVIDLEERQTCADLDTHWTQVEPLYLQIKQDPDPDNWPSAFDTIIPILGSTSDCHYFRGIQKRHTVNGDSYYLVRGFIESVQGFQGGFPGWVRICFVIYDANRDNLALVSGTGETDAGLGNREWLPEEDWPPSDLEQDFHWIYGYEGVILPGGRIMLGRWVDMKSLVSKGPFIFWDI